jgi:hypothetical protein
MTPILGIWASQNYNRYSLPKSFESIATTTVGAGGTATITFSSIPQTYTHLQIRGFCRTESTNNDGRSIVLRFNSDSGSNYSWHYLIGYQTTSNGTESYGVANQTYGYAGIAAPDGVLSNVFSGHIVDILDYANTNKYKTTKTLAGYDINGTTGWSFLGLYSSSWRSTSAITSIDILTTSGDIAQYSQFALYGIKGE